jgi:hypothetical protein
VLNEASLLTPQAGQAIQHGFGFLPKFLPLRLQGQAVLKPMVGEQVVVANRAQR